MSNEDIKKIIGIMAGADGGCVYCASAQIMKFVEAFSLDKKEIKKMVIEVAHEQDRYWKDSLDKEDDRANFDL